LIAIPNGVGPAAIVLPATLKVPSLLIVYADIPPPDVDPVPLLDMNAASPFGVMTIDIGAFPVATALPFRLSEPFPVLIV
jgi:hypothetical protein